MRLLVILALVVPLQAMAVISDVPDLPPKATFAEPAVALIPDQGPPARQVSAPGADASKPPAAKVDPKKKGKKEAPASSASASKSA